MRIGISRDKPDTIGPGMRSPKDFRHDRVRPRDYVSNIEHAAHGMAMLNRNCGLPGFMESASTLEDITWLSHHTAGRGLEERIVDSATMEISALSLLPKASVMREFVKWSIWARPLESYGKKAEHERGGDQHQLPAVEEYACQESANDAKYAAF